MRKIILNVFAGSSGPSARWNVNAILSELKKTILAGVQLQKANVSYHEPHKVLQLNISFFSPYHKTLSWANKVRRCLSD